MTDIVSFSNTAWDQPCAAADQERALQALEGGGVLLLPQLGFALRDGEERLLSAAAAGESKNVSLDPRNGQLKGNSSEAGPGDVQLLQGMMQRYADASKGLLHQLLPRYDQGLRLGRTSFRPSEIAGRVTSWRKDDTRLHVDSFPSSPMRGRRILRVFTNINPSGQPRTWKLGEPFERVAQRYLPSTPGPLWGAHRLFELLGITKGRRSAYDHFMLQLHDRMKADLAYQAEVEQATHEFQPGSTWIVYTDQTSHAALRGQYVLEQTCYLPVEAMGDPGRSPLRVLERLRGQALV